MARVRRILPPPYLNSKALPDLQLQHAEMTVVPPDAQPGEQVAIHLVH